MTRIAIFASGSGTNAENIARIFNEGSRLNVSLVLVNRRNAGVIARMEPLGVPVEYVPNSVWDHDPAQVVRILKENRIDLVVLAGFMHYVAPEIVEAYRGRILNIHPSLLPKFGGKGMYGHYVHEAVIAAGEKESGVTVHYVTEECDGGEILLQRAVEVTPGDTAETLEAKIHPVEYQLYPEAIVLAAKRLESENSDNSDSSDNSENSDNPVLPLTPEQEWAKALGIEGPLAPPPAPSSPQPHNSTPPQHQNSTTPQPHNPMPPTGLLWSVLATVCCCFLPGIVAIVFSSRVSKCYYEGDLEGAEKASRLAQIWIIVSFVLGLVSSTLWFPLVMVSGL